MIQQFDNLQKLSKDHMDVSLKTFGTVSKGAQAIAVEVADFSKKSFEQGTAALEKLVSARTLDKAFEVHTDYLKSSYETLVAQSSKLGEIYTSLAKEAFKPFETLFAQTQAATQANVQAATRQTKAA